MPNSKQTIHQVLEELLIEGPPDAHLFLEYGYGDDDTREDIVSGNVKPRWIASIMWGAGDWWAYAEGSTSTRAIRNLLKDEARKACEMKYDDEDD